MPRKPKASFKVGFNVKGLEEWVKRIEGAQEIVDHETRISLVAIGAHLKPLVQSRTPTDKRKLHNAINFRVDKVRAGTWRLTVHADGIKYAVYVEKGTKPHWPPINAIRGWAERHGIAPFLVARAIAKHGTIKRFGRPGPKGAAMFERTYKAEQGWINSERTRLLDNIVDGIVHS